MKFFLPRRWDLSFLIKYELLVTSVPCDLIGPDCQGSALIPGGDKDKEVTQGRCDVPNSDTAAARGLTASWGKTAGLG